MSWSAEFPSCRVKYNFDCVFYYVSDLEKAISFYARVLGLKLVSRDVVARFAIDGVLLELVPAPHAATRRGNANARLCLRVDNIHQALEEFQSKGISASKVVDKNQGFLASVEDPDGNEICLWQYR
jgi:catechol 2,3-dioxygenase-like lactoylglutathione lyase family enzyme